MVENDVLEEDVLEELEWLDDYYAERCQLMFREDYAGLIQCSRSRLQRWPNETRGVYDVAQAYVLAGHFEQAIDFVRPYYEAEPENFEFQACMLEALAGLGKAWHEFPWKSPPPMIEMSDSVLDECYHFLRPKRKPRAVWDLYDRFISRGHLLFTEDDLLRELRADERFAVSGEDTFTEVSTKRKK